MPAHLHQMSLKAAYPVSPAQTPGPTVTPAQGVTSPPTPPGVDVNIYGTGTRDLTMSPSAIGTTGESQAQEKRLPFLTVSVCIALQGIYPSRP